MRGASSVPTQLPSVSDDALMGGRDEIATLDNEDKGFSLVEGGSATPTGNADISTDDDGVLLAACGSGGNARVRWLRTEAFHTAVTYVMCYCGNAVDLSDIILWKSILHLLTGSAVPLRTSNRDPTPAATPTQSGSKELDACELLLRLAFRRPRGFTCAHLHQLYGERLCVREALDVLQTAAFPLATPETEPVMSDRAGRKWSPVAVDHTQRSNPMVRLYTGASVATLFTDYTEGAVATPTLQGNPISISELHSEAFDMMETCGRALSVELQCILQAVRVVELRQFALALCHAVRHHQGASLKRPRPVASAQAEYPTSHTEGNSDHEGNSLVGSVFYVPTRKEEVVRFLLERRYLNAPHRGIVGVHASGEPLMLIPVHEERKLLATLWDPIIGEVVTVHEYVKQSISRLAQTFQAIMGTASIHPPFTVAHQGNSGASQLPLLNYRQLRILVHHVERAMAEKDLCTTAPEAVTNTSGSVEENVEVDSCSICEGGVYDSKVRRPSDPTVVSFVVPCRWPLRWCNYTAYFPEKVSTVHTDRAIGLPRHRLSIFISPSSRKSYLEAVRVHQALTNTTEAATPMTQRLQARNAKYVLGMFNTVVTALRSLRRREGSCCATEIQGNLQVFEEMKGSRLGDGRLPITHFLYRRGLHAEHLIQYLPAHRWFACLETLYPLLQSIKLYEESNECLSILLDEPVFRLYSPQLPQNTATRAMSVHFSFYYRWHKRGGWVHRLAMNLLQLKQKKRALTLLENEHKRWEQPESTETQMALAGVLYGHHQGYAEMLHRLPSSVQRRARILRALWPETNRVPSFSADPPLALYHAVFEYLQEKYCRRHNRLEIERSLGSLHKQLRRWTPVPRVFDYFTRDLIPAPVLGVKGFRGARDNKLWRHPSLMMPAAGVEEYVKQYYLKLWNARKEGGVWKAVHCEGLWMAYLSRALLWDAYCYCYPYGAVSTTAADSPDDVDGLWLCPLQEGPLDMSFSIHFASRRHRLIEERLDFFETCPKAVLVDYVAKRIREASPSFTAMTEQMTQPELLPGSAAPRTGADDISFLSGEQGDAQDREGGMTHRVNRVYEDCLRTGADLAAPESSVLMNDGDTPREQTSYTAPPNGLENILSPPPLITSEPVALSSHGKETRLPIETENPPVSVSDGGTETLAVPSWLHDEVAEAFKVDVGVFPLMEILRAVPQRALIQLLRRTFLSPPTEGYGIGTGGYPDLVFWNCCHQPHSVGADPSEDASSTQDGLHLSVVNKGSPQSHRSLRLVEVKSPNDTLSTKQRLVNDTLMCCGFDVSIAKVVQVPAVALADGHILDEYMIKRCRLHTARPILVSSHISLVREIGSLMTTPRHTHTVSSNTLHGGAPEDGVQVAEHADISQGGRPTKNTYLGYRPLVPGRSSFEDVQRIVDRMTNGVPNRCPDNLQITKRLADRLNLQPALQKLRFVHIAGTKGKGTTAAYTAALLQAYGYKVGLFTSPHLTDMRERIVVDNKLLSRDTFARYFFEFFDTYEALQFSESDLDRDIATRSGFFRIFFLLSLHVFAAENVDVAVMEVGLGGRTDSTNVVPSEVSVITALGMDHMEILGNTIDEIAAEKAGILKPNCVCFAAPQRDHPCTRHTLEQQAKKQGAPLVFLDDGVLPINNWPRLAIGGDHAVENSKLAIMAARRIAGIPPVGALDEVERHVLQTMTFAGRSQIVPINGGRDATFYLDGAHTPESLRHATKWFLAASTAHTGDAKPRRVLLLYNSRKPSFIQKAFMPYVQYFCKVCMAYLHNPKRTAASPDPTDTEAVASHAREAVLEATESWRTLYREVPCLPCAQSFQTLQEVLDLVVPAASDTEEAEKPAQVFVVGSFYLVGDIISLLKKHEAESTHTGE